MNRVIGLLLMVVGAALTGCKSPKELTLQRMLTRTRGPSERQLVKDMFLGEDADTRRAAVETLSTRKGGCREPYLKGYAVLTGDPSPLVRGAALRALGRGNAPKYGDKIITGLNDKHATVRWDAAAALGDMVYPQAIGPLSDTAMNDPSTDVRVAAAKSLRHYQRGDVVETLLRCLDDAEFAVRFQAADSLTELTGENAGADSGVWRKALSERKELFEKKPEPKRRWYQRRRKPKPKLPAPAPATRPATQPGRAGRRGSKAEFRRPWWDWGGVTRRKLSSKAPATQPAAAAAPRPRRATRKAPWWDWFGVTRRKRSSKAPATQPVADAAP